MFAPVMQVRATWRTRPTVAAAVSRAVRRALEAPTGPVYLEIPTDLLRRAASDDALSAPAAPGDKRAADLAAVAGASTARERPLVWAGGGARGRRRRGGARWPSALGAPVLTTYGARGILPLDHPLARRAAAARARGGRAVGRRRSS